MILRNYGNHQYLNLNQEDLGRMEKETNRCQRCGEFMKPNYETSPVSFKCEARDCLKLRDMLDG